MHRMIEGRIVGTAYHMDIQGAFAHRCLIIERADDDLEMIPLHWFHHAQRMEIGDGAAIDRQVQIVMEAEQVEFVVFLDKPPIVVLPVAPTPLSLYDQTG